MYNSLSSVRNVLRSSSLISQLARNHVDLKSSRSFSAFPPIYGLEEKSNTGTTRNFDNLPRTQVSPQGGQGFPQRLAWNPNIGNRIDFVNRGGDPMRYVRDTVRGDFGSPQNRGESTVDFVHIKIRRNNSFVTVTDSKGNKKFGFSSGSLPDKAGSKSTRFSAEAVSEHVGRMCRSKGVKSVVIKVNGHIHFKKKKQAVMGWIEGYTNSRADQIPVVSIEDTTRKPHNGCRLPKARRT